MNLADLIRDVPDYPKPGVLFKDITPLLADGPALAEAVRRMADPWRTRGIGRVVGIEARGFVLAAPVAIELGVGFVPVRKQGKLPYSTLDRTYDLEYGTATLEIHEDAFDPDEQVLIVDDVLATGGTVHATAALIRGAGARVAGVSMLLELGFLNGRERLGDLEIQTLLS